MWEESKSAEIVISTIKEEEERKRRKLDGSYVKSEGGSLDVNLEMALQIGHTAGREVTLCGSPNLKGIFILIWMYLQVLFMMIYFQIRIPHHE